MNELDSLIKAITKPSAKYEERKQTLYIYLKEEDDTYYIICNKDNFKTCTFFATVKNQAYNETITRQQFDKIKEGIKK